MAGMTTQLNLVASHAGTFSGLSAQFSGDGFSDMRFDVRAVPPEEYKAWLVSTHSSAEQLDLFRYARLAEPSRDDQGASFGQVTAGLFERVVHNHGAAPSASSEPSSNPNGNSL
jgi:cytochrome o ubiquinol oxidase subunit II